VADTAKHPRPPYTNEVKGRLVPQDGLYVLHSKLPRDLFHFGPGALANFLVLGLTAPPIFEFWARGYYPWAGCISIRYYSRYQNAGRIHNMKIDNSSFEMVDDIKIICSNLNKPACHSRIN